MSNSNIISLINQAVTDRLKKGKREYAKQVDVFDGRNWTDEALEESLDLAVYLSAEILKRRRTNYQYFGVARLANGENGSVWYEDTELLEKNGLMERIYNDFNKDAFGDDEDDWITVYADQVWVVKPGGEVESVIINGIKNGPE